MLNSLSGNWIMESDGLSFETKVPGSVLETLLRYGVINDPFKKRYEYDCIDFLKKDYSFKRTFEISKFDLEKENYLYIYSLDTVADVYINGKLILKSKDMHKRIYQKLDNSILKRKNEIEIKIYSAINYVDNMNPDLRFMALGESYKNSPYLRKANYMFGWDWGPILPDMGIYGDIGIISTNLGYIDSITNTQIHENGIVKLNINVNSIKKSIAEIEASLFYNGELIESISKVSKENQDSFEFEIKNPRLWWPIGYGEQNLYKLKVFLRNEYEETSNEYNIGLRKIVIDDSLDKYGKKFDCYCNDTLIYLKGSDYIPMDNIIPRVTDKKIDHLLELMTSFNHNVIRVWGGGYYPVDHFYDKCDELGILVFQDLMFACALYDTKDREFVDLVKEETIDSLNRISYHPSILLICGNNENETAINSWINESIRDIHKELYVELYHDALKPIVDSYKDFYYLESSPTGGVTRFEGCDDYNYMDSHYWAVWHGLKPFSAFKEIYPRLLSEFGCQSFPILNTVKYYADKEDMSLMSPVMMSHQKNRTCNDKILFYIKDLYNEPKDFESLVYLSMLSQAEGIKSCVEHLRRNRGRCNGVLYWQLNDCWPGQSWSSLDYFFNPKALHYYSKKFYNEIIVSADIDDDKLKVFVTNDSLRNRKLTLKVVLESFDGEVFESLMKPLNVDKESLLIAYEMNDPFNDLTEKTSFIYLALYDEDNELVSDNYFTKVYPKNLDLRVPNIKFKVIDDYTLTIESDTFTPGIEISTGNNGEILTDNYFTLEKGVRKIIKSNMKLDENKIKLKSVKEAVV